MKKESFRVDGLLNIDIAEKIERKLKQANIFGEVKLDFDLKTLFVKYNKGSSKAQLLYEIEKVVNRIDKNIIISKIIQPKKDFSFDNQLKINLIIISIAFVFFILSIEISSPALCMVLIILSYLTAGISVAYNAVKSISNGKVFNKTVIITIATIAAIFIGNFTEAALVMIVFQAGVLFQSYVTNRSRIALIELMDVRPRYANIKTGDEFIKANPLDVLVGEIILIKPGECVPLDCEIIAGKTTIDTSPITGDTMIIRVSSGDKISSGFINISKNIEAKVINIYKDSTVSRVFETIDKIGKKRAPIENKIQRLSHAFTPSVVALAVIAAILPPLLSTEGNFTTWIYRALVFLVISCHGSIVASVPISLLSGIGSALRSGILIKKASAIEKLEKLECIAFNKTGIVTNGIFEVVSVNAYGTESSSMIEIAAHAESLSNHPIARAICKYYQGEINTNRVKNLIKISGRGITADIDGREVIVGNSQLMRNSNIVAPIVSNTGTIIHIAVSGAYWGYLELIDRIRDKQKTMMLELKVLGIPKTVILTGDSKSSAEFVAKNIGADEVHCELLPADKAHHIESLMSEAKSGKYVAFIGDGVVDAQALATADLGMILDGLSYESNIKVSDVVIFSDNPSKICTAIKTGKNIMRIIKANFFFAVIVKIIFLILAVKGHISMFEAVFADVFVYMITIGNSMRALKKVK